MSSFKNKSDQTYVDGDLVIRPNETVKNVNDDRAVQFRGHYSWQFEEVTDSSGTDEEELRANGRQNPVAPINASVAHAEIMPSDDNGLEVEPTDTGVPTPTAKKK